MAPTCAWGQATTTVQVTETMISTVYIHIPSSSSVQSLSSQSEGDSGGRPPPPRPSTTTRDGSPTSIGLASSSSSSAGVGTVTLTTEDPSGMTSGWIPTVTTFNNSTDILPSSSGTTVESTTGLLQVTTITGGSSLFSGTTAAPLQTSSILTGTQVDGASSWTLSWLSSSTVGFDNEATTTTLTSGPSVRTFTGNMSGVLSTRTITAGASTQIRFPNTTATTELTAPPKVATSGFIVITRTINGTASTWTLIGGTTIVNSEVTATTTSNPSGTLTGGLSTVTSIIGGVPTTWTLIGDSTFIGNHSTATSTPTPSVTDGFTVITGVISGVPSTWAVIGGSTVVGDGALIDPTPTPSQPFSGGFTVVTSLISGVPSMWTVIGGSTVVGLTSTLTVTSTPSPTTTDEFTVITSLINGMPSVWTVIDGSTVVGSSNATTATSTSTPSPALSEGFTIITSVVGGANTTWTIIGDSNTSRSSISTAAPSLITTIIDGNAVTRTVIGRSTITGTPSSTTSTPTESPEITVITGFISGIASTWTVIRGSTVAGSLRTEPTVTPATMTSAVGGVDLTWTVIGGSTTYVSLTNTVSSFVASTESALPTTAVSDGVVTFTLTGGATLVSTLNDSLPTSSASVTSSSRSSTSPTTRNTTPTSGYASAFTSISIIAFANASTCYSLPTPTASLHESLLNNTGRAAPYIDALYLNQTTNSVKYLRLVDNATDAVLIDVSDPSKMAIIDKDGDVLSIDSQGLHFTSANCSPRIDIFISGFFEQLDALTNSTCGNTTNIPVNGAAPSIPVSKRQEAVFDVILHLKDQCGQPARASLPVSVSLGETECLVVPGDRGNPGDFVASCAFPGSQSNLTECETSVQQTLDHLTKGSFAGTCLPLASVWNLLSHQLGAVIITDEMLRPFVNAGLDIDSRSGQGIISVIDGFLDLYDFSTSTFRNSSSEGGPELGQMIEGYGVTSIRNDVCHSAHASEPLNLTFTAGAATISSPLALISTMPSPAPEYERNVTDPAGLACCPNPGKCNVDNGQRFYPAEASIEGTDCLCGTTLDGSGVGFRTGRCVGYDQCNATSPCAGGAVCLIDNCCGFSVCVNGTECSASLERRWTSLSEMETSGGVF
ncbi:hypothetical protein CCHL11_05661 [Colletotrichum chlorophyti]|uniref:Uncharacterized protein n=1 Tax=Colletotrichum chlorophyti TaxID=708187 RepID=A0A1Q8RTV4_9PEZI|nr:hypothetical protein CCHL11_05661 [Colletotrichum chlorophyti]